MFVLLSCGAPCPLLLVFRLGLLLHRPQSFSHMGDHAGGTCNRTPLGDRVCHARLPTVAGARVDHFDKKPARPG